MNETNEDLVPQRPERSKSLSHLITLAIIFVLIVAGSGVAAGSRIIPIASFVAFIGIMHYGSKADNEERWKHEQELKEWHSKIDELGNSKREATRILEERRAK